MRPDRRPGPAAAGGGPAGPTDAPSVDAGEVAVRGPRLARLGVFALFGAIALASAAPAAAEATLRVSALDAPGRYEFIAAGYGAHETLSTWLTGPNGQVVAAPPRKADDDGEILFTLRLPRYYEPGQWALTAHGLSTDREAVVAFELPPRAPDLALAVEPTAGPPGTVFTVTGEGFRGGERVSWWLTAPDGVSVDGGALEASAAGRVRIELRTAADAMIGPWTLVAYGDESDQLGTAPFIVAGG
jgi:hypothetical protein